MPKGEESMVKKDSDWQTKMFLLNCHESGHKKRSESFHNGAWFIYQGGLIEIMKKMSKPQMEERKEKRKICLLCAEQEFDVISHEVRHYHDYEAYYQRECRLIIPSVDYDVLYYEARIPFSAAKERAIIARIEENVPASIYERAGYYRDQTEELKKLLNGRRKCNGHLLLCPRHSNEEGAARALKKMVEVSLGWQQAFYETEREYFRLSFPIDDDFLKANFAPEEISIRVKSAGKLEKMIQRDAFPIRS